MDFDTQATYKRKGWSGTAWRFSRWEKRWEPLMALTIDDNGNEVEVECEGEGEWVSDPDTGRVYVHMVGDDGAHLVDVRELAVIPEDSYCGVCGQIGCGCNW